LLEKKIGDARRSSKHRLARQAKANSRQSDVAESAQSWMVVGWEGKRAGRLGCAG